MNVEVGTEAAQFPEKEYINGNENENDLKKTMHKYLSVVKVTY
jgi:hypothetical protein